MTPSCKKEPGRQSVTDSIQTVLFVGNSLTYTNDLPLLVTMLAKEKGVAVETEMLAFPNYALEDHWNDGLLQQLIHEKKYDFVVVQQGPSSQEEGRRLLLDYGLKIKTICDEQHTRLAFFMVWPTYANLHHFEKVIKNYTEAATVTGSLLCPVGSAWKKYFSDHNDYSYYGPDGFHPSDKGSKVAASIIVGTLFE